jgi:NADH-quinone oxidoreductase subunit L
LNPGALLPLLAVAVPAASALLLASWRMPRGAVVGVGNAAVALAFVLVLAMAAGPRGELPLGLWLGAGVQVPLGFESDVLSRTFALVTTGVGLLIHAYSGAYMAHDRDLSRYFSGLNLFVAAMLLLVLADGPVLLLIGWAGVGLASYLLIGFWYERAAAVAAARKAFLINTAGDVALMLAIALMVTGTGQTAYAGIFAGHVPATAVAWLLFFAAAAKSAQIPLHTWLPDAMEGPTPVSALIHAATMVTAGVYLLLRFHPVLAAAPAAAEGIAVLGGAGCLLAALMATAQRDIKRVLAFSTMSQVGYMFMGAAAGAGALSHVVTHAFFKALLFMGAGVVMHALGGEERDLYRMGGLRERLPATSAAMGVAALAMAGFPLMSGYFSKDAILASLWANGHPWLWAVGVVSAGITALYIFRMYFLAFWGRPRTQPSHGESWLSFRWPMAVLALLCALGGLFVRPREWFSLTAAVTLVLAFAGFAVAYRLYALRGPVGDAWLDGRLGHLLRSEFGFDALYRTLIVRPGAALAAAIGELDRTAWAELASGVATAGGRLAEWLRGWQSGAVRRYALTMLVGAALALLWVAVR